MEMSSFNQIRLRTGAIIAVLIALQAFSCHAEAETDKHLAFVRSEIDRQDVEILTGPLMDGDGEVPLMVGVHYVDQERQIFDAAIFFSTDNGDVRVHGKIMETRIFDSNGRLLADAGSAPGTFFGWEMRLRTVGEERSISISFDAYFDGGESVTHLATVRWDEDSRSLVRVTPTLD